MEATYNPNQLLTPLERFEARITALEDMLLGSKEFLKISGGTINGKKQKGELARYLKVSQKTAEETIAPQLHCYKPFNKDRYVKTEDVNNWLFNCPNQTSSKAELEERYKKLRIA